MGGNWQERLQQHAVMALQYDEECVIIALQHLPTTPGETKLDFYSFSIIVIINNCKENGPGHFWYHPQGYF